MKHVGFLLISLLFLVQAKETSRKKKCHTGFLNVKTYLGMCRIIAFVLQQVFFNASIFNLQVKLHKTSLKIKLASNFFPVHFAIIRQ